MPAPKIAIVAEFLTVFGGAERVLQAMHEAFPEAPIYTALYDKEKMPEFHKLDVRTSWLQKFPNKLRKTYKLFPTLQVQAFRDLDLSEYDIILTSSYLNANQVRKTRPGQVLISYCHTPARYYWSHYEQYRKNPGFGKFLDPLVRTLMPLMVPRQRKLDYEAAQKVDVFLANSTETKERIKKYYGRESIVLNPPVATDRFKPTATRGDYYITMGRQLPYKHFEIAVQAATDLGKKLVVFGNGRDHEKLVGLGGSTVEFRTDRFGDASDTELEKAINSARGFLYPCEEDFGIVQVEALAGGAPVIAYGKGGARDIVQPGKNGILFQEQTVDAMKQAIVTAENTHFNTLEIVNTSKRFDKGLFVTKLRKIVGDNLKA